MPSLKTVAFALFAAAAATSSVYADQQQQQQQQSKEQTQEQHVNVVSTSVPVPDVRGADLFAVFAVAPVSHKENQQLSAEEQKSAEEARKKVQDEAIVINENDSKIVANLQNEEAIETIEAKEDNGNSKVRRFLDNYSIYSNIYDYKPTGSCDPRYCDYCFTGYTSIEDFRSRFLLTTSVYSTRIPGIDLKLKADFRAAKRYFSDEFRGYFDQTEANLVDHYSNAIVYSFDEQMRGYQLEGVHAINYPGRTAFMLKHTYNPYCTEVFVRDW